jgi:hypothetical protein
MCCYLPQTAVLLPSTHTGHISSAILPHPYQVEMKFSLPLCGHQLGPGGAQSALQLPWTVWFPQEQMIGHAYLVGVKFHSVESGQLQYGSSRQQSEVLCL